MRKMLAKRVFTCKKFRAWGLIAVKIPNHLEGFCCPLCGEKVVVKTIIKIEHE